MPRKQETENKLYGVQTPTFKNCGDWKETFGNIVATLIANYDYDLLQWEKDFIEEAMALNSLDEFLYMICILIVPRRNGKTLIIIAISLFLLTVYPEYVGLKKVGILYSAHRVSTNSETFKWMLDLFDNEYEYPDLYALTHWGSRNGIGKANGKERIECRWEKDGVKYRTTIEFNARSKSNGRGLGKNFIFIDEAQEFTSEEADAMLPTVTASAIKPQIYYMGTPHYPNCPGDVFRTLRERVYTEKPNGILMFEWSVDEIGDIRDRQRWANTNPSFGYILREDVIEGELMQLSEDGFARERLGWWAKENEMLDYPIKADDWNVCATNTPLSDGILCLGVKFDLSGSNACLTACLKNIDEYYIELLDVFDCSNGMENLVAYIDNIGKKCAQIIIDGRGTAYDLFSRLQKINIPKSAIIIAKTSDLSNACSMLASAIVEHNVTHYAPQTQLNDSALTCTRRLINKNGDWGFDDSDKSYAFIIESASLAYFASRKTKRNPNRKGRIG